MIQFPRYMPDQNALAVPGIATPFPAGSLVAVRQDDMLAIASPVDGTLICQWALFDQWVMADGTTFAGADAAFAVLDAACRQKRLVGSPQRNYGVLVTVGQSRFALDPAPADVNTVALIVNGILYAAPDIAVSDSAVDWQGPFLLGSDDDVRFTYF